MHRRPLSAAIMILAALSACSSAPKIVRQTEFERGTLFGLERVTHDDTANEVAAAVCSDTLVFETNKDGNAEIYTKPITGREITRKTTSPAYDGEPTATMDCSRIAFVSLREGTPNIYVIAGREASAALKIGPGTEPRFSRDGSALFYQRFLSGEGTTSIWKYDFTNRQSSQLVTGFHGSPSPDGKLLAYAKTNPNTGRSAIWVLDLSTQQEQEVASVREGALVLPVWSPDAQKLLVTVNHGQIGFSAPNKRPSYSQSDLGVVGRDGSGFTMLTDNPAVDVGMGWSADGWVYFTSVRERTYDVWRFQPRLLDEPLRRSR